MRFFVAFSWVDFDESSVALQMCKGQSSTVFDTWAAYLFANKLTIAIGCRCNWLVVSTKPKLFLQNHFYKPNMRHYVYLNRSFKKKSQKKDPTKLHPRLSTATSRCFEVNQNWQKCPNSCREARFFGSQVAQKGALLSVTGIISGWCWNANFRGFAMVGT